MWDADAGAGGWRARGPQAAAALGVEGFEATRSVKGPDAVDVQDIHAGTHASLLCSVDAATQGAVTHQTAHEGRSPLPEVGLGILDAQETGCTVDRLTVWAETAPGR